MRLVECVASAENDVIARTTPADIANVLDIPTDTRHAARRWAHWANAALATTPMLMHTGNDGRAGIRNWSPGVLRDMPQNAWVWHRDLGLTISMVPDSRDLTTAADTDSSKARMAHNESRCASRRGNECCGRAAESNRRGKRTIINAIADYISVGLIAGGPVMTVWGSKNGHRCLTCGFACGSGPATGSMTGL